MKTANRDKSHTRDAQLADPTREERGFTRMTPSTRGLLVKNDNQTNPFFRGATAKSCKALTPCVSIMPDGTRVMFKKSRKHGTVKVEDCTPATVVKIRHRTLRGPITDYLDVAERYNFNLDNVANEYRYRRDNGYSLPTEVQVETNATFRGGDK